MIKKFKVQIDFVEYEGEGGNINQYKIQNALEQFIASLHQDGEIQDWAEVSVEELKSFDEF